MQGDFTVSELSTVCMGTFLLNYLMIVLNNAELSQALADTLSELSTWLVHSY